MDSTEKLLRESIKYKKMTIELINWLDTIKGKQVDGDAVSQIVMSIIVDYCDEKTA